jgi:hypothetical protein
METAVPLCALPKIRDQALMFCLPSPLSQNEAFFMFFQLLTH